jgi:hypothetical protein
MESTFTKNERKFFTPVPGAPQRASRNEKAQGDTSLKNYGLQLTDVVFDGFL